MGSGKIQGAIQEEEWTVQAFKRRYKGFKGCCKTFQIILGGSRNVLHIFLKVLISFDNFSEAFRGISCQARIREVSKGFQEHFEWITEISKAFKWDYEDSRHFGGVSRGFNGFCEGASENHLKLPELPLKSPLGFILRRP